MLLSLSLSLPLLVILFLSQLPSSLARSYSNGDRINIQVNNVRPFHNPAEAYDFYSLPYCKPSRTKHAHLAFGDALAGDRKQNSLYEILFRTNIVLQRLCTLKLSQNDIKAFIDAIKQDYMFELFVDDLPVMGFVGDMQRPANSPVTDHLSSINSNGNAIGNVNHMTHNERTERLEQNRYFLYTHLSFQLAYHSQQPHLGGHVIAANLTTSRTHMQELVFGQDLEFDLTFSANWKYTPVPYASRYSLHRMPLSPTTSSSSALALELHWLSILNSSVLVLLLVAFLGVLLLRILRNDLSRYLDVSSSPDELELGAELDDSGWKQVSGDVFRPPTHPMLLSALLGTGVQLLSLSVGLLFLALAGFFSQGQQTSMYSAAVLLHALTSCVGGYATSSVYGGMGGSKWASAAVLGATVFTGPLLFVFSVLNSLALANDSQKALPTNVIVLLVVLWALVGFPLAVLGALRAKRESEEGWDTPCKTNMVRREIPETPMLRKLPFQVFLAGFLPFSAIYVELHYVFSAIWGFREYNLFHILGLALLLVVLVTSFITVALVYFQLAIEDYRWWWRSFMFGGAAGGFILAYAVFFFFFRSQMSGTLQTAYFFGYSFVLSYAFSLMLGSVGFFSSLWFVRRIYGSIKSD